MLELEELKIKYCNVLSENENLKNELSCSNLSISDMRAEILKREKDIERAQTIIRKKNYNIRKLQSDVGNLEHFIDKLRNEIKSYEEQIKIKKEIKMDTS